MVYRETHTLRDGRILLYRRDNSPYFQVRFNIIGLKGYIVRSTKTARLAEAHSYAEKLYEDLTYKSKTGIEVFPHTFETLWKRWLKAHQYTLSKHRMRYISGTVRRYFLEYFSADPIEQISQAKINGYWDWRINYWSSADGVNKIDNAHKSRTTEKRPYKQKLGNVAKIPAQKTLQMEQSVLRQILRWAHNHGLIERLPEVKAPKLNMHRGISRRPAFEFKEWQALYRHLREWVKEPKTGSKKRRGPNSHHMWHRRLFRSYILFMGVSGLRPNEARQLRWRDVKYQIDSEGNEYVLLKISENTKTGARECVPLAPAKKYLQRVRDQSLHTDADDLIFCGKDGNPIENFGKTFKTVLKDMGILEDDYGKARTIYSLRHTYATFVLLKGHGDVELLAQNMGTSPTQIFQHYRHITVRQKSKQLSGKLHSEMSTSGLYF